MKRTALLYSMKKIALFHPLKKTLSSYEKDCTALFYPIKGLKDRASLLIVGQPYTCNHN